MGARQLAAPADAVPAARARASSGCSSSTSTRASRCSSARSGRARSRPGFTFSLDNWTTYPDALARATGRSSCRSLVYGAAATTICFLIAYPLAYTIAFRGGRYKNLLLFLVIAPFFTSFLLRTQSWKIILGDDGILFGPLKDLGLLPPEFRVLATPAAVDRRHHLQLPAVHDPADLRLAREDRRPARRGGEGPVRRARGDRAARSPAALVGGAGRLAGSAAALQLRRRRRSAIVGVVIGVADRHVLPVRVVHPDRPAAVAAGRLRRLAADVHPGDGRLRQRRAAGQPPDADDRQRHPEPVPREQRLPDRGRPELHADGRRSSRWWRSTPGSSGPRS